LLSAKEVFFIGCPEEPLDRILNLDDAEQFDEPAASKQRLPVE
jgi:hypothetical protein